MAGRSLTRVQGGVTDTIHINTDKFAGVRTMSRSDGSTISVDRTAHSGVRTMQVSVDELPLTDATTSIQVTVAGHSDLDGIYTGSTSVDAVWSQQGGNGQLHTSGYNSESDSQMWFVVDSSDFDPTFGNAATTWGAIDRPWNGNLTGSDVTITGIAGTETITIDRSPDRKGESRPLLSKVVGGAAAAYSLRDLNDKAGNNKVVEVRRSSDNADRKFLAKEVYNGTLEAWVGAGNDGFVETWYDQSGENFHMLQAESTKQPKIVENGTFLGSVKYDGVDDYLKAASMFNIANQAVSLFSVQTRVGANDSTLGATNSGRGISFETTAVRVFITVKSNTINHPQDGSGFLLGTAIHTGDGSSDQIKITRNGVEIIDSNITANDILADSQPIASTQYNVLGGNRVETTSSNFFIGEIKEVVIWKTNQLANRPAIEANINNQYDIY